MQHFDNGQLLSREQVARRLGFSVHTIIKWQKNKKSGFPRSIPIGPKRTPRWRAIDIEQWVDRQERQPAPKKLRGAVKAQLAS